MPCDFGGGGGTRRPGADGAVRPGAGLLGADRLGVDMAFFNEASDEAGSLLLADAWSLSIRAPSSASEKRACLRSIIENPASKSAVADAPAIFRSLAVNPTSYSSFNVHPARIKDLAP